MSAETLRDEMMRQFGGSKYGRPDYSVCVSLEMGKRWVDAVDQLRARIEELEGIGKQLVAAADACDQETERHPSSRSSAPLLRYIQVFEGLRRAIGTEREPAPILTIHRGGPIGGGPER